MPPLAEPRSGAGGRRSPVPGANGRVEETTKARGREPGERSVANGASAQARGREPGERSVANGASTQIPRGRELTEHTVAGGSGAGGGEQRGGAGGDASGEKRRAESQQQDRRRLWLAERHSELDRVRAELRATGTGTNTSDRRRLREEMRRVRSPGAPIGEDTRKQRIPGTKDEAAVVDRMESADVCTPRRERLSLHKVRQLRQRSVGRLADESPERGEGSMTLPSPLGGLPSKARSRSTEDPTRCLAKAREDAAMRRLSQQGSSPSGIRLGAKPVADGGESSPQRVQAAKQHPQAGLSPSAQRQNCTQGATPGPDAGAGISSLSSAGGGSTTSATTAAAVAAAAGAQQALQVAAEDLQKEQQKDQHQQEKERMHSAQLLSEAERVIQVLQEQKARLREVVDALPAPSSASAPMASTGLAHLQASPSNAASPQIQDESDGTSSFGNWAPPEGGSFVSPSASPAKDPPIVLSSTSSASVLGPGGVDSLTRSSAALLMEASRLIEGSPSSSKPAAVPALQLRKRPSHGSSSQVPVVTRLESTASCAPGVLYSPVQPAMREATSTLLGSTRGVESMTSLRSPRSGPSPRSTVTTSMVGSTNAPLGNSRVTHSLVLPTPSSPVLQERMVSGRAPAGGTAQFLTANRCLSPPGTGQPPRWTSPVNASAGDLVGVMKAMSPRPGTATISSSPRLGFTGASASTRAIRQPGHHHGLQSQFSSTKQLTTSSSLQSGITRMPSLATVETFGALTSQV